MDSLSEENKRSFYACRVIPRQRQMSDIIDQVQDIIQTLTEEISKKDIRFQPIHKTNRRNENIKVLAPTQIVVTVPIKGLLGYRKTQNQRWRYYSISGSRLISPIRDPEEMYQWLELNQFLKTLRQWHENDVTMEGDIMPAKVLEVFLKVMIEAIKTCNLSHEISIAENIGPNIRVNMHTTEFKLELELIPVVEIFSRWCEKAQWPRCLSRWPSRETVRCVKSFGFDLLAHSSYHWQLGFDRAENALLERIDDDGGCRKTCYRIMRQLKEEIWCPEERPVITAEHLRAVLFWTCEKYPKTNDWREFKKAFLRLIRKLYNCVNQQYLKHFFVKGTNMFQYVSKTDLDTVAQRLKLFLKKPELPIN